MNRLKKYKQYFTPIDLADLMVKLIPEDNINTIVDLSMGECGLLEAAKKRWENASLYGADIDATLLKNINLKNPYIHTYCGDSLSDEIIQWDEYQQVIDANGFDLAIANPPFNYYDQAQITFSGYTQKLPIEMRFLLKYLNILKDDGYLCIILPYGFLSLDLYKKLRKAILSEVKICKIIKVFERCFKKIDADTCLVLMQKKIRANQNTHQTIAIEYLDENYSLVTNGEIVVTPTTDRLDLEYYTLCQEIQNILVKSKYPTHSMGLYISECKRGKTLANKEKLVSDRGLRYLHTTDLNYLTISTRPITNIDRNSEYFKDSIVAPEDILVGRVGKACIGKVAIIPRNFSKTVISDCIWGLTVQNIDPYYLALFLASKYGQMQLKGIAKGSCSKYITQKDLLRLLVVVPDLDTQLYFREKYITILSKRGRTNKKVLLQDLTFELENSLEKA